MKNYQKTKWACYFGFVTQAITANFVPMLFLCFHSTYEIPLGTVALIPTCFYFTQLLVDLFCVKFVDRIGYRICVVASEALSALGLLTIAFLPEVLPKPFAGILIGVILYAIGSGLIEVLCSPIVEACPFPGKEATMSLLHSFYCWGSVGTIFISTAFFAVFGLENWKWMAVLWALIPAANIYGFATCPLVPIVEDGKGMGLRQLFAKPVFWCSVVLMICAGASEISMAQWASAYAESALGLSKALGDLVGPCLFAVFMGLSRVIFGKFGERMNLMKFMTGSGLLCVACYVLASVFSNPMLGLIGCVVCGFSVAIMWPGTISISSQKFPRGGTAMFAILAMAGDLGGSLGPSLVGRVSQLAGDDLHYGIAAAMIFPLVLLLMLFLLQRAKIQNR